MFVLLSMLILPLLFMLYHLIPGANDRSVVGRWLFIFYGALLTIAGFSVYVTGINWGYRFEPYLLWSNFSTAPGFLLDPKSASMIALLGIAIIFAFYYLGDTIPKGRGSYFVTAWIFVFGLVGVFLSYTLVPFYFFWELSLMGAYFWIGIYGRPGSDLALIRFLLFTLVGSLTMLISVVIVSAFGNGDPAMNEIPIIIKWMPEDYRQIAFWGFFAGFAVKLPLMGFHGWMRDTYRAAPPVARSLLSAVMSKLGAWGFLVIFIVGFPDEIKYYFRFFMILSVIGVVYGGFLCIASKTFLDILIYASLVHLSLIAVGIFSGTTGVAGDITSLSGALFQMFNHGIIMVTLLALEFRMNSDAGNINITGLKKTRPRLAAILLAAIFSAISLPGMSNFVGELVILYSAYRISGWYTFAALIGLILSAVALLKRYHEIFMGLPAVDEQGQPLENGTDLSRAEMLQGIAIIIFWILLGFKPMLFLEPVQSMFRL